MKKLMSVLLASAMILALAAGCGGSAAPAQSAAPETAAPSGAAADTADLPEVTIHVASIFEPGTAILKGIDKFGELLGEKSGGKITLNVYASGSTGGEKEQAEALKLGEIDMAAFGTLPISIFTPETPSSTPPSSSATRTTSWRCGTASWATRCARRCSTATTSTPSA